MTPGRIREPRWLQLSGESQPFVATACAAHPGDALARVRAALAQLAIDDERELGAYAAEWSFSAPPRAAWVILQSLKAGIEDVDLYLQPAAARGKKLLICDMDMTIVAEETLDEVAARLGFGDRVAEITRRAMLGELEFEAALRERIAMLAGQPEQVFQDVARQIPLNPGANELLAGARAAGMHTILISGGFAQFAEPVALELGFDEVFCNHLEIEAGRLTGRVREPIVNADFKRRVLEDGAQSRGLSLEDCCAIGDGANDLPMLAAAGLGIAYRAKPVLRAATSCHIDATDLRSALYFTGLGDS
jgi:phosphoserine phosphatase